MTGGRHAVRLVFVAGMSVAALAAAATPTQGEPLGPDVTRPHNLKLLINGKRLMTTPLAGGADNYVNIHAGQLRVEARWTTNARGTGYHVVISTIEPSVQNFASCAVGTLCLVRMKQRIEIGQEMSWAVKLVKTRGNKIAAGFKVCLTGRL